MGALSASSRSGLSIAIPLWVVAVLGTLLFLRMASDLLIPIVLAIILSYALEPVVAWLEIRHVHRLAGTGLVLLTCLGLLGWGAFSLRDNVRDTARSLPQAAERLRDMVWSQTSSGTAASVREAAEVLQGDADSGGAPQPDPASTPAPSAEESAQFLQQGVRSMFALAGHAIVVVFLVFFLLAAGNHVRQRLIEVAGSDGDRRRIATEIIASINSQIQRFLLVQLVTAVIVGIVTWAILALMGTENAALWAALAGAFNSIPYFGPAIVSGGLFAVGLMQGGMPEALQLSGAVLLITSLEGWLLTPLLLGKAERMSAVAVFLGLLLWTWLWGAWGTLLAVPMLVIVKSVADHITSLRPVGRLLAP